jgi:hypothetical protein
MASEPSEAAQRRWLTRQLRSAAGVSGEDQTSHLLEKILGELKGLNDSFSSHSASVERTQQRIADATDGLFAANG